MEELTYKLKRELGIKSIEIDNATMRTRDTIQITYCDGEVCILKEVESE